MSEQIQDQISAFMDDELSPQECEFFVRRLERDTETRSRLVRYLTVGAVLRGESAQPEPSLLRRRLEFAMGGVPIRSEHRGRRRLLASGHLVKPLLGAGIALSVALAALLSLRFVSQPNNAPAGLEGEFLQATQSLEAPSYVVPRELAPSINPPMRLTNYLMHHGEYASGLNRTLVRSSVVSTREADVAAADEIALE